MLEKTLVMTFENELGKTFSIKVKDILDEISPVAVKAVMDFAIAKSIFQTSGGALTKKVGSEIVTKETTVLEVA